MSEDNGQTKLKIKQEALRLFAQYGYKAVSIRDICKSVGIKESSIYYHYKNKQEILDTILQGVDEIIFSMEERFEGAFSKIEQIEEAAFCQTAVAFLQGYLLNPNVYPLIQMLSIEKIASPKAAEVYQKLVFKVPIEKQEKIFTEMVSRKLIEENSPKVLAYTYYAIIYLAFEKNCLGTVDENGTLIAAEEIQLGMSDFYRKMRGKK